MTDRDFDQLLYQGADQLPPKSVEQTSPDPWRQALLLICWGIALTSITLNFLNLQYILPAVGAMLLCLGFRSLRRENGWFRQCYVLSILLALYRGATDLLLATPLAADLSGGWSYLLGLLGWLVSLWLLFALWRALKAVFLRAELPAKTRAAGGMVICYFLLFLLALVNASGWLLLLPVLILWICLLTGLFKTSRALDHAGYAIQPAPVRLSNGRVLAVSLGALLLAALACLLIFSRYPVEASATQLETGQKELRQELLGLGFPEEVLADLTDQEVALLDGATAVYGERYQVVNTYPTNTPNTMSKLSVRTIQVILPGGNARYYYYFSWKDTPFSRFKESIGIVPGAQFSNLMGNPIHPDYQLVPPQGQLLWECDGQTMSAPLVCGGPTSLSTQSLFGSDLYQCYTVNFSLPMRGEHIRGYLAWTLEDFPVDVILTTRIIYTRQTSPLQYPWISAIQNFSGHIPFYQTRSEFFSFTQLSD